MSDKRVVFEQDGVRVYEDGVAWFRGIHGDWVEEYDSTATILDRALAESEAKRKALEDFATRFAQDVEAAAVAEPTHIAFVAVHIWGREARKALKANPATDSQVTIRK